MKPDDVAPFRVEFPEADLDDLRRRVRNTRWPEAEPVSDWSQGVPLAYLRELCAYWADGYNWRAAEKHLNALPQSRTEIDGLGIHFLHVRSPQPEAMPLLITHGWRGSIIEYLKAIGPLTDSTADGGSRADAFHVVCPSLPGYGFSDRPAEPGWNVQRIAGAWIRLMARLGYDRYGAQGGGHWGNSVSTSMAQQDAKHVIGIHINPPIAAPDPATFDNLTDTERTALDDLENSNEWESGYSAQMSTLPQTVGHALLDSPDGLCAWIVEKFRAWTDCAGHPENALTRDEMLDDITLYWLTGAAVSSARLYWESSAQVTEWFTRGTTDRVTVPIDCSIFPGEVPRPSRRRAAKRYTDIRHWGELDKGGHFAAFEQPELFVREVRTFLRMVR
jgi:pimeloyl-ACP methyl ester carboxylesterase